MGELHQRLPTALVRTRLERSAQLLQVRSVVIFAPNTSSFIEIFWPLITFLCNYLLFRLIESPIIILQLTPHVCAFAIPFCILYEWVPKQPLSRSAFHDQFCIARFSILCLHSAISPFMIHRLLFSSQSATPYLPSVSVPIQFWFSNSNGEFHMCRWNLARHFYSNNFQLFIWFHIVFLRCLNINFVGLNHRGEYAREFASRSWWWKLGGKQTLIQ